MCHVRVLLVFVLNAERCASISLIRQCGAWRKPHRASDGLPKSDSDSVPSAASYVTALFIMLILSLSLLSPPVSQIEPAQRAWCAYIGVLDIRCGQTGWIIALIFALVAEPKGSPGDVSRKKSPKILTALYPVNHPNSSSTPK